MIYKYFFYYTVKIGNSISHCNIILDLPSKIDNAIVLKGAEKYLLENTPNAEIVCICNWKYLGDSIDDNINKGDMNG